METSKTKTEVLLVRAEHAAVVAEFFRAVWDANSTPERVLQARALAATENSVTPGEPPPSFIFLSDGRVVGFVGSIPIRLWDGESERGVYWAKGLMVLPEFRKGPVGYLLLKEAIRHLPFAMAVTVVPAARKLFEALGFKDVGLLPNYIRVLRPTSFLKKLDLGQLGLGGIPSWAPGGLRALQKLKLVSLVGGSMRAASAIYVGLRRGSLSGFDVAALDSLDASEVTILWQEARGGFVASPVRDAAYLETRYQSGVSGPYRFAAARKSSRLQALAVVRRPSDEGDTRLKGIRVATLSDLLFSRTNQRAAMAAISGAENVAREMGADAMLCSACHASLTGILPKLGYAGIGGNIHFLVRDTTGQKPISSVLSSWHLMRGDSSADEVF
jgi:GNAT superfamily N-acetyltransferase